jgi:hyperosmotically inducible periplasmic protein
MKIKEMYSVTLMVAAVVLLVTGLPVHASTMDDLIQASAEKSYVFKTYLKDDDIKIQSKDGVVSLTGTVSEESHKSLAQETVAGLPGVERGDNRLEVKGDYPAEKSDAWLSAKVKTTLLFHQNVSAMTEVSTKNGIVTLKGDATSQAQKDLTTEYARDVEGVKDVWNDMRVFNTSDKSDRTLGEKIDDASITAQVKMVLLFHRSTSALNTRVNTKHGVVTLSGEAGNAAEKDLVSKLVHDIKGVKTVENEMTVKSGLKVEESK